MIDVLVVVLHSSFASWYPFVLMICVRLMFNIKFCSMCSSNYDIKVEAGQSVHLFSSSSSVFLFHVFHSSKFPHLVLINFSIIYLEWPCLSLFLLTYFLNSLLFQYFNGLGNFSFSVYFELSLVWPAFIKHDYVNCIVS